MPKVRSAGANAEKEKKRDLVMQLWATSSRQRDRGREILLKHRGQLVCTLLQQPVGRTNVSRPMHAFPDPLAGGRWGETLRQDLGQVEMELQRLGGQDPFREKPPMAVQVWQAHGTYLFCVHKPASGLPLPSLTSHQFSQAQIRYF